MCYSFVAEWEGQVGVGSARERAPLRPLCGTARLRRASGRRLWSYALLLCGGMRSCVAEICGVT